MEMTIREAIENRQRCYNYLIGCGVKATPENVEAVRLSIVALREKAEREEQIEAVNAVPVAEMKEFAEDVLFQYGYKINCNGGLHITAGGLSVLEAAFDILGWEDPHPFPDGECEVDGCHEYATCGMPTPDGYKRVCGRHCAVIQARKEAENAKMDGERKDNATN